jgi:hypothetical protein
VRGSTPRASMPSAPVAADVQQGEGFRCRGRALRSGRLRRRPVVSSACSIGALASKVCRCGRRHRQMVGVGRQGSMSEGFRADPHRRSWAGDHLGAFLAGMPGGCGHRATVWTHRRCPLVLNDLRRWRREDVHDLAPPRPARRHWTVMCRICGSDPARSPRCRLDRRPGSVTTRAHPACLPGLRPRPSARRTFLRRFFCPTAHPSMVAATSSTNPPTGGAQARRSGPPTRQPYVSARRSPLAAQRSPQQAAQRTACRTQRHLSEPTERSTCHAEPSPNQSQLPHLNSYVTGRDGEESTLHQARWCTTSARIGFHHFVLAAEFLQLDLFGEFPLPRRSGRLASRTLAGDDNQFV